MEDKKVYFVIDLKSFFASVECVERGLDPMTTDLIVADMERTDRTICLAVSPSLKAKGVKNRCRVFEIPKNLDYIVAVPRMQKYVEYAAEIYGVYLDYISPDDMHVYSIDEVFIDATPYLRRMGFTPREFAKFLMEEVARRIGVRATCGIGTNMYLAKIALDITAKSSGDFIGYLDRETYINTLWDHRPLTDFWRIGPGTARKLARIGIDTMGGIARADTELLYRMFGVDAELLIDHAWGIEPTRICDIKNYTSKSRSLSSGQVLMRDYSFDEALIVMKEMTDSMCLDLTNKKLLAKSFTIAVGYSNQYALPMARGMAHLRVPSNLARDAIPSVVSTFREIVDPSIPIRRMFINANDVRPDSSGHQLSLFELGDDGADSGESDKNRRIQETVNEIKSRFGKNAMLKGIDFEDAATTRDRNNQIGGHRK
ncbi:MAG: DNA repair protein [Anaerovoracaceae bacterium]